ncbi:MAG: metal ABC transporter substrate-binding protein [Candidatus Loosdrechtia sp.]|uniref:metal ABC transporter substrate-binding protein n=1 Tax=Candidatus Loosdrechtia sp. TaxID=3101272 RepID=UPI003A768018|nr:MAG: metal ABC transporter substrate-binding protein [Candidatus Jettenia sp. AMX2]
MKIFYQICLCFFFLISWMPAAYAKLNIVATTPDLGALAKEIGRDMVNVTSIAMPTEDPHFTDARPGFIVRLNKADMLIESGMQLEIGWLPTLVHGARNRKILPGSPGYLNASTGISVLNVPNIPASGLRAMGDVHPMGNPHFTLDPISGYIAAANICERLCQIDQANCEYYRNNLEEFSGKLEQKLSEWQNLLKPFQGTKIVTYHDTFPYFARRFNLDIVGTLEPKPGITPSPTHLNALIPAMKRENVQLILVEQFRERRTPEFVAAETGAKVVVLPIMVGGKKEINDYISLIDYTVKQIASALKT